MGADFKYCVCGEESLPCHVPHSLHFFHLLNKFHLTHAKIKPVFVLQFRLFMLAVLSHAVLRVVMLQPKFYNSACLFDGDKHLSQSTVVSCIGFDATSTLCMFFDFATVDVVV